jgi:hypothetical protein
MASGNQVQTLVDGLRCAGFIDMEAAGGNGGHSAQHVAVSNLFHRTKYILRSHITSWTWLFEAPGFDAAAVECHRLLLAAVYDIQ